MIAFTLSLLCLLPLGSIAIDIWVEEATDRQTAEMERLSAALPEARVSLLPVDWPEPVTPLDLPGIGKTDELAAVPGAGRVRTFEAVSAPLVAEVGGGRHRLGVATGTVVQRATWDTPTGQFWLIVGDLDDPCTHCTDPEPGEPAHAGCPGCACPCALVEVAA